VTAGGTNYLTNVGTLAGVSNSTVITLASGASGTDNIYNGSAVYIASGLGSGQVRSIVDYTGSSKAVRVSTPFSPSPNTSSTYIVSPKITITGDGQSATAYCNVASGAVNYINPITPGVNYSKATVTISANTSHGSGATAVAQISPPGGHGSDPVGELGGYNVMLNIQLSGSEGNTFPTSNDFRILGLVKDPTLAANGSVALASTYDQTTQLVLTSVSDGGRFDADELIAGGTTTATARVVSFANTNSGNTAGVLRVVSANAVFAAAETITGNTSGVTATIGSITYGSLTPFSGEVIYIENRPAVQRASDQIEDVKIVVKF